MTLDRRAFLVRTGLLVGAGALAAAGCRSDEEAREAGVAAGLDTWAGVRRSFALDRDTAELASFLLAPHPRPVREAIEKHRSRLDANAAAYIQDEEEGLEIAVVQAAAAYLGVAPEEIALTGSTTMGLALLYATLRIGPGEEILTTDHDFYSTHESLRLRAEATGATVRRVRLYDEPSTASVDAVVGAVRDGVRPGTRAVALTWVHSGTGVKLPVRAIADALAERDAELGKQKTLLCVDAVHGFGVEHEALPDLGCDFFVSGCHKWLFGPRGTGIVWGRSEAWPEVRPTIPSFTDAESFAGWLGARDASRPTTAAAFAPGGYHAFEHRWALAEAFAFRQEIGRARAAERTRALATRLKEGLGELPGVTVRTPLDAQLSAGLVCIDEPNPGVRTDVVRRLREEHGVVASMTPYSTPYLRFGPSIVNTEDDVDRAVAGVAAIYA